MWVTALPSFTVKHYEFTIYTVESSNAWISWKSFRTLQENGKRFSFSAAWWDVIMGWSWHATPRLYTLTYKIWNKENSAQQIVKHLALAPRTKILNPVCFFCVAWFPHARCHAGFTAMVPASDGMQWTHWSTMQSLCLLSIVTHFYLK